MTTAVSRIGIALTALDGRPYADLLNSATLAEECGYELVLVPEAWGRDATVVLGALAARTTRIGIGTGIVNVYSRSPALIAMAAATLDEISGCRAVLGLGVSGRAVVEGWHGAAMDAPLARLREVTEAVRAVIRRERRGYAGGVVRIAPGFRMTFAPPRDRIPVWHASLTPAGLPQGGAVADGWPPLPPTPESPASAMAFVSDGLPGPGRERAAVPRRPRTPAGRIGRGGRADHPLARRGVACTRSSAGSALARDRGEATT